jgi:hypothetical protein
MEEGHLRRRRIPSYPFENAKHWRLRAEAMRTLAEEAIDSTVRAMMLRIAADYDRLAESADDRAAHNSIMFGGNAARKQLRGTVEVGLTLAREQPAGAWRQPKINPYKL